MKLSDLSQFMDADVFHEKLAELERMADERDRDYVELSEKYLQLLDMVVFLELVLLLKLWR